MLTQPQTRYTMNTFRDFSNSYDNDATSCMKLIPTIHVRTLYNMESFHLDHNSNNNLNQKQQRYLTFITCNPLPLILNDLITHIIQTGDDLKYILMVIIIILIWYS